MKTTKLLAVAAIALIGCGDNKEKIDAGSRKDTGGPADAYCSNCPAAPALGDQIDRMGRPAVNTALNHGFDLTSAAGPAKVAYNEQDDKTMWGGFVPEFMINLGILDALDTGVCGNGNCETGETNASCAADCPTANQTGTGNGCGNQVLYNGGQGGGPTAMSYGTMATLLSDDELYLDTTKMVCAFYLAVEFAAATGLANTTCGGRAPQYDVIDFTYSAMAMGIRGFSTDGMFTPQIKDDVGPHADVSTTTFPYLGPPH